MSERKGKREIKREGGRREIGEYFPKRLMFTSVCYFFFFESWDLKNTLGFKFMSFR